MVTLASVLLIKIQRNLKGRKISISFDKLVFLGKTKMASHPGL